MGVLAQPEALPELSAAPAPGAPGPTDRMARPQHVQPSLAVAGPHFGAQHRPRQRAPDDPIHDHGVVIIEPDQMCRPAPDEVANEAIISIDHPGIDSNRVGDPSIEFIGVGACQVAPAGLPINGVEFDIGEYKLGCERLGEGRLSRARCADDSDPLVSAACVNRSYVPGGSSDLRRCRAQGWCNSDKASITALGASCGRKWPATGTMRR